MSGEFTKQDLDASANDTPVANAANEQWKSALEPVGRLEGESQNAQSQNAEVGGDLSPSAAGELSDDGTLLEADAQAGPSSEAYEAHELGHAARGDVPAPPETGDLVVDAALRDLAAAAGDLDAQLEAAESVHRTLHSRLADLGG